MPSFLVEYSDNIEEDVDLGELVRDVHEAAHATGLFQRQGMRTRATPVRHYRISDGRPENGFVQITARLKPGRSPEERRRLGAALLAAARARLDPVFARRPFAVYVEVLDVSDVSLNIRTNS